FLFFSVLLLLIQAILISLLDFLLLSLLLSIFHLFHHDDIFQGVSLITLQTLVIIAIIVTITIIVILVVLLPFLFYFPCHIIFNLLKEMRVHFGCFFYFSVFS